MLSIACALLDCPLVIGVDIDRTALSQAQENIDAFEGLPVELLQWDICKLWAPGHLKISESSPADTACNALAHVSRVPVVDFVIMNPPFGSWQKGADCKFLAAAMKVRDPEISDLARPQEF